MWKTEEKRREESGVVSLMIEQYSTKKHKWNNSVLEQCIHIYGKKRDSRSKKHWKVNSTPLKPIQIREESEAFENFMTAEETENKER